MSKHFDKEMKSSAASAIGIYDYHIPDLSLKKDQKGPRIIKANSKNSPLQGSITKKIKLPTTLGRLKRMHK